MVDCMLLLLLHVLLLSGTTLADENPTWRGIPPSDETFPPPPDGRGPDEEDLMRTYGQLKSMYYSLKAKLDRKASLQQEEKKRPRIYGSNNVAMSPIFLDLDNIETFNDISSFDTPTAATEATTSAMKTTTTGPIILGQDALGRQIVRFINQWEEQINDITEEGTSVATWPTTTPSTTVITTTPTTTSTTTMASTTTTLPSTTTPTTTTQPTTTAAPVVFPSFFQHNRDEEPSFPIRPDLLIMGPRPPVPVFETTVPPPPIAFNEQEREEDPLIMGPPPPPIPPSFTLSPPTLPDFQTTSFFSRATPTPFFDESTFPSFITEVTEPPRREEDVWREFPSPSTTPPTPAEDTIWWTPRPAFLNMSSILMAPPPEPVKPIAPQPLWHPHRKPSTLPPPPPTTFHPEIEPKIRKVAEQSVINDLELAAGSLNMPELVKELRGEQQIPPVLDYLQMEKILEMKRKTLEQLEILEQLANRRNRLQDLIENQKRLLNQARGNRIQQVEETAEVNRVEPIEQPKKIDQEIQIPTTISAIPEEARWPQRKWRKGDSGKKRRQRQRHSRRPKMVDDRVPTVDELTQLLETELKQAQRDAKVRELRELCSQAMCSFEKGDFCRFETSYDEITRRQKNRRRNKRSEAAPFYVIRSWSNWVGTYSPNGTRVDRAPHFSPENKRFAGVFLEPQQLASLTLTVSYADTFTVRFRAWEATKGMRLRVCCDDFCPFSTDIGRSRRKWRQLRATCPAETRQLAFECEMVGSRRKGVCAIDDVFVEADECPVL